MEKLDNRVLHLVMYASTKSGVSFQTTRAFAIILVASLSATYLNIASDCKQQSKTELKTLYLSFAWSLHPSKPVEETSKNAKAKINLAGSHINVDWACSTCASSTSLL